MKRSFHTCESHGSLEDAKLAHKYYSSLDDYSKLQKEVTSKKRKLQVRKRKRKVLQNDVGFLRQRLAYLKKLHIAKVETKLGPSQNQYIHEASIEKELNCIANVTNTHQENNGEKDQMGKTHSVADDESVKLSIKEKKSEKKKVTWKEEVVVHCI
ncbi:uncharacterized protein LOC114916364 [Cajanus cajan]|uniref:uncharacterized protein LOC114916364 n=1 Tax=Cajanus cajan TaxID=3821 RepID=UPI0010FB5101|nr:uncharacterized protein LOC114916364 [Cajanus cajan]